MSIHYYTIINNMVNYSDGKIYKLVNNVDDKIYVGSTCGTLRLRKSTHKWDAQRKRQKDRKVYKHLNQVGWGNVEIILIEKCECKSRDELHRRERHWIDELKPELNKARPCVTAEEIKQRKKEYAEENKEHLKNKQKEYVEKHKEKIRQIHSEYYQNNKKYIADKQKIKTTCECGSIIRKCAIKRHERSKKHQNYLQSLKD